MEEEDDDADIAFARFIYSLGRTTAVHFGDIADPATGQRQEPDLGAAQQMIDLIGMLQIKTMGNLTPEEAKLMDDLLYELRMRFVEIQQGRRSVEP